MRIHENLNELTLSDCTARQGILREIYNFVTQKKDIKMAYTRRNLLERMIEVQDITLGHTRKGITQRWVYENVIRPRFHISLRTFNTYLGTNAKSELRKTEAEM